MKKSISYLIWLCMTVALLVCMTCFVGAAGTDATVELNYTEAGVGQTFDVDVTLTNNPGLVALKLDVTYDETKLELVGVSNTALLGEYIDRGSYESAYPLSWLNIGVMTDYQADGKIATLTFRAKDDLIPGDTTQIEITCSQAFNSKLESPTILCIDKEIRFSCVAHDFSAWRSTGRTMHEHTCTICGFYEKVEHNWNEGTITQEPTCKDDGNKRVSCIDCQAIQNQTIEATGLHEYGAWTDFDAQSHRQTCRFCAKVQLEDHAWDAGTVVTPSTCNTKGTIRYQCTTCEKARIEYTPFSTTHQYGQWVKASETVHVRSCNVCHGVETEAHDFSDWITAQGKRTRSCAACEYAETIGLGELQTIHTHDGFSLRSEQEKLPNGTVLDAQDMKGSALFETMAKKVKDDEKFVGLYDLNLMFQGSKLRIGNTVSVTLPIPQRTMYNSVFRVVYINDAGEMIKCTTKEDADTLIFQTDHFSYYGIIEVGEGEIAAATPVEDAAKPVNFGIAMIIGAGVVGLVLIVTLVAVKSRKKR